MRGAGPVRAEAPPCEIRGNRLRTLLAASGERGRGIYFYAERFQ
jgi:hypothetical protein